MTRVHNILAIALLLSSCVANTPNDLSFVSLTVVDFKNQAELPLKGVERTYAPYHDFMWNVMDEKAGEAIGADDFRPYFLSDQATELQNLKDHRPIFRIDFQTNRDLADLNNSFASYTMSFDRYFCDRPDAPIRWGLPGVYWDGLYLSAPLNYSIDRGPDGKFTYYAFMHIFNEFPGPQRIRRDSVMVAEEQFDLRDLPADICFRVRGGSMGLGYRSNVVVIPKAAIIDALEQMPPALR